MHGPKRDRQKHAELAHHWFFVNPSPEHSRKMCVRIELRGTGVRVHSTHRLDRRLKLSFRIPSHSARLTQSVERQGLFWWHGMDVLFSFRLRDPINCRCALVNQSGGVAQMVERTLSMREAQGSIPCSSTLFSTSSCLR